LGLFWVCSGFNLGLIWVWFGVAWGLFCICFGIVFEVVWGYRMKICKYWVKFTLINLASFSTIIFYSLGWLFKSLFRLT
jgi:hypothetical protein